MVRYYTHRSIHIETFYHENGSVYAAFDVAGDDYETDTYEDIKLALKEAIATIDKILESLN